MSILKNPRHEVFAQKYAKSGNGKQSYIAAGYSAQGAEASASALLRNPKVAARISEISTKVAESVVKVAISERSARLAAHQENFAAMEKFMQERRAHSSMKRIPGGNTGRVCVTKKLLGKKIVIEYAVDVALLREMREILKEVSVESGQRVEKRAETDPDGNTKMNFGNASDEELREFLAKVRPEVVKK